MPKNAGEAGKIKTSRDGARDPPYADDTDIFVFIRGQNALTFLLQSSHGALTQRFASRV
jgi:hypothetical protein